MDDDDRNPIECLDCGEIPILRETPYAEHTGYVIECGCEHRSVDVTECMEDTSLLEPITGKWSNVDHDTRIGSGDPNN